ncbi:hypothetical protein Tco_0988861 [Tanacetum coccineum]|uniref:Uncharacterized protein n=1 Tax=Tanacetum coccineum TaxID=301880 RepID=A0ABQ5ESA6_9ASTR
MKNECTVLYFPHSINQVNQNCECNPVNLEFDPNTQLINIHVKTNDNHRQTIHTGVHTTTDGESFKIHSLVELESIWLSMNATYCKVIHIGGSKFSLEFENKHDVYTSTRNDDESNLVGGSLGSNPEKSDEPTTGHVNDGDTPTKDGSGESDGSYASTFPAQGCKKENSKFVMNHVSPYMDDGKHVNEGIEATERSLSSQLGEQVGSRKPRPTKIELEKIIAYSQWLNENEFIKSICEGFISGKACWDGTPPIILFLL